MKNLITILFILFCVELYSKPIKISTLDELLHYSSVDSVEVIMSPGEYIYSDRMMAEEITLQRHGKNHVSDYNVAALINFSGKGSSYYLEGVSIEIAEELHAAFPQRHLFEVFVSGNGNMIKGLCVHDAGDMPPASGAIMMHISGDDNRICNVALYVKGSYPYGYGHLLGKGANPIVKPKKHSSLLITGKGNTISNCRVETHAFGHGIVMQGAVNTVISNCYVKGFMRSTDEMLCEKDGPAFNVGFKSDYPPGIIQPGEMKALSEDGVRAYPSGYNGRKTANILVENTVVENMRSGFCFAAASGNVAVFNCTSIGCQEKGFSLPSYGVAYACKSDAKYGPAISFIDKDIEGCIIDLEYLPSDSPYPPKRTAEIQGRMHHINIHSSSLSENMPPIVFGESFWTDVYLYRNPEQNPESICGCEEIELINTTGIPIVFTEHSEKCKVFTNSEIEDKGIMNFIGEPE